MSNSNTATYSYRLRIQRDSDGVWFPTGQVSDAYLQEARDQALFESQRRGITGPDPNESVVTEEPLFAPDMDGQISGLTVRVSHGTAQLTTQFTLELFSPASQVEAARLVKAGQLQQEATFRYRVFAQRVENLIGGDRAPGGVVATVRRKPLPLVDGRLSDWLDRARPAGPMYDTDYPVLITEQALELSREYSRRPGTSEGGAMLLGHLYRQREPTPEIFAVIDAALEAQHAKHEMFRLDLSAETFARFNTQLELRRTRLNRPNEVPLAFAHGHNFLPSALDGKPKCADCPLRPTCPLTSAFYSPQDELFHRSLFARAPFAVGLVWGLTPREENDLRVFCLDGGQTRERGYYQITS